MTHIKIIKIIMAHSKVKHVDVAKELHVTDERAYFNRIFRKNVTFNIFLQLLDLLGYEVVFRPKGGNLPEYHYRMMWDDYNNTSDE